MGKLKQRGSVLAYYHQVLPMWVIQMYLQIMMMNMIIDDDDDGDDDDDDLHKARIWNEM